MTSFVKTRVVGPEPKQFWVARVGARKFWTVELEPEIWVPAPRPRFTDRNLSPKF